MFANIDFTVNIVGNLVYRKKHLKQPRLHNSLIDIAIYANEVLYAHLTGLEPAFTVRQTAAFPDGNRCIVS